MLIELFLTESSSKLMYVEKHVHKLVIISRKRLAVVTITDDK